MKSFPFALPTLRPVCLKQPHVQKVTKSVLVNLAALPLKCISVLSVTYVIPQISDDVVNLQAIDIRYYIPVLVLVQQAYFGSIQSCLAHRERNEPVSPPGCVLGLKDDAAVWEDTLVVVASLYQMIVFDDGRMLKVPWTMTCRDISWEPTGPQSNRILSGGCRYV